jgi:(p)ppGpp synthase/HD superfamily hydrolase
MFSAAVERALAVALEAHAGQERKDGMGTPYVTHPLHVSLMLARAGLDDDVVVAGLLHDVVEDCDAWTLARVDSEFGAHVAAIVGQLTEDKSRTWDERKRAGVEHVAHMSPEAASVKACDKLHNLRSLREQLEAADDHDAVWSRFTGGRDRTLSMASDLVAALSKRIDAKLARALQNALRMLQETVEKDGDRRQRASV